MSPIRQEVLSYIDLLPDLQLEALKPILAVLASPVVETDLTEEEEETIRLGREEYRKGTYLPLHQIVV